MRIVKGNILIRWINSIGCLYRVASIYFRVFKRKFRIFTIFDTSLILTIIYGYQWWVSGNC